MRESSSRSRIGRPTECLHVLPPQHFSCDDETDLRLLDEACTISANEVTPKTLETTV